MQRHIRKIAVGAAATLAVVGAGGAIAATQLTPKQESEAVVDDVANQLGVDPAKLTAALRQALKNRVDAAVRAGRLTKAQGSEIRKRIDAGELPLLGVGGPGFHRDHLRGPGGELKVAASYLGMTQAALRTALDNGQTLAEIAKSRDKSVDGLVSALVAAEKKELDQAVKDGELTAAQRDAMLAGLEDRMTALVNGACGPRPGFVPPPGSSSRFDVAPPLGSAA